MARLIAIILGLAGQFDYKDARVYVVKRLIPGWAVGMSLPGGVLIVRGHEREQGLLEHELVHQEQKRRMGVVPFFLAYLWQSLTAMIAARSTDPRRWYPHHPLEAEAMRRSGYPKQ